MPASERVSRAGPAPAGLRRAARWTSALRLITLEELLEALTPSPEDRFMNPQLPILTAFLALLAPEVPVDPPLPPGAVARFGDFRGRDGSGNHHRAVCLPAHNLLATAGRDSFVHIFDLTTGQRLRTLTIDDSVAGPLAFSPDGKLLVVESRTDLCLFDLGTGKEKARLKGHLSRIDGLAFSPDGRRLASIEALQGVRLWQVETGKPLGHFPGGGYQRFVGFTPDGKSLALLADTETHDRVRLLESAGGEEEKVLDTGMSAGMLVFSPDGSELAVAGDQLRVWNRQTGKRRFEVNYPERKTHQRRLCKAAYSPNGKLLATASAQTILLINAATGQVVRTIQARPAPVETDSDGTNTITLLAFSPDGSRLYSWSCQDRLRVWDPANGKELLTLAGHETAILSVVPSSRAGLVVSQDASGQLRLWEMMTGKKVPLSEKATGEVLASDGRWLVLRKKDAGIVLVEGRTGAEHLSLPAHSSHFAFSPDGRALVGGRVRESGSQLRIWHRNLAGGVPSGQGPVIEQEHWKELQGLRLEEPRWFVVPSPASFSADSRLLAVVRWLGDVQLLHPATQRVLKTFEAPQESRYTRAVLSPDGSLLAAVFDGDTVRIWDTASFAERGSFQAKLSGDMQALAFSPDGYALATGGDHRDVMIWEVATGQVRQSCKGHQGAVTAVSFSPDGRYVLSGSQDWTALVWRVGGPAGPLPRDKEGLSALWEDLANRDARLAWPAMLRVLGDPERGGPWLREQLKQVSLLGAMQVAQLIRNLDSDSFEEREKASAALIKRGKEIEEELKRALAGNPSAEVKVRLEQILETIKEGGPPTEKVRLVRVLELLERIGTPQTREELTRLGRDRTNHWLPEMARAALRRLDRK